jgi:hypothetical protein
LVTEKCYPDPDENRYTEQPQSFGPSYAARRQPPNDKKKYRESTSTEQDEKACESQ